MENQLLIDYEKQKALKGAVVEHERALKIVSVGLKNAGFIYAMPGDMISEMKRFKDSRVHLYSKMLPDSLKDDFDRWINGQETPIEFALMVQAVHVTWDFDESYKTIVKNRRLHHYLPVFRMVEGICIPAVDIEDTILKLCSRKMTKFEREWHERIEALSKDIQHIRENYDNDFLLAKGMHAAAWGPDVFLNHQKAITNTNQLFRKMLERSPLK